MGAYLGSEPCRFCKSQAKHFGTVPDEHEIKCPQCGDYYLTGTVITEIANDASRANVRGSWWIADQNASGATAPRIDSNVLLAIASFPQLGITERSERLLIWLLRKETRVGAMIEINDGRAISLTHCMDLDEVGSLAAMLGEEGLIKYARAGISNPTCKLTLSGRSKAEGLLTKSIRSVRGFVAMWFDQNMNEVFDAALWPAIFNAGYEPFRVDMKDHANKIDDEIIAGIRQSRFIVADYTGHRGGVYYESGFAQGLGIPVIWTCHKAHAKDLHFDIRQYNCLLYDDPDDLRLRLQNRIEAVLDAGPQKERREKVQRRPGAPAAQSTWKLGGL